MSKVIEGVVDTCSKEERLELINYVSSKVPCISVITDFEGFSLVGVHKNSIGLIGTHVAKSLVDSGVKHFTSVKEFIDYYEGK